MHHEKRFSYIHKINYISKFPDTQPCSMEWSAFRGHAMFI